MQYNRILLKLSGESLMGEQKYGIDTRCLESYARQIHEIAEMGIQIGIVIGGGNIFRGCVAHGFVPHEHVVVGEGQPHFLQLGQQLPVDHRADGRGGAAAGGQAGGAQGVPVPDRLQRHPPDRRRGL